MQARNESSAGESHNYFRRQSRKKIPHRPPINTADGSGTEVVSAACSAARRLEPEAARQPKVIQIFDALLLIEDDLVEVLAHLNKPILQLLVDLNRSLLENFPHS